MNQIATWVARFSLATMVSISVYGAAQLPSTPVTADPLRDKVVALDERLSNMEGKLDYMEKLEIGLMIAVGGQLVSFGMSKRGGR